MFIQPRSDGLVRIVREDELPPRGSGRIPAVLILAGVAASGGIAGFILYRRRVLKIRASARKFAIDPETVERVARKVTYLFEVKKIHRREELTLQLLAREMAIPAHLLSRIINENMHVTFSELVNSSRVDEVKKRLTSPDDAQETVLAIAFESGFATKTAFNRVFKRLTRMTPSQYRERHKPQKPSP